jgi:hypothetical protein
MSPAIELKEKVTFRPFLAPIMAGLWYVIAALASYDLLRRGEGREAALGLAAVALLTVVVYAIAHRPAVVADARGVLLRNVVRDVWLPWHLVKSIEARWSLLIATADDRHGSWAMTGGNAKRTRRGHAPNPLDATSATEAEVGWTVRDLLEQLRRRGASGERTGTVEVRPAWPVIAAFGLTVLVLVVLLAIPAG